jgi:uncharacterized phage protein gp47/JayE
MAVRPPLTSEISDQIITQLESAFNQTIPLLPRAFNRVLAKVFAGVFILVWKYVGWMFFQLFISTASNELTQINGKWVRPLTEWGRLSGAGDPTAATRAEMTVTVTGTAVDTLVGGTQLLSDDNGFVYIVIGDTATVSGTFTATIRAVGSPDNGDGSGALGNLDTGRTLSFVSPPTFVERDVTVLANTVVGADAESVEDYRQRVFNRWAVPPQGGAYADYREWMIATDPAVINAYVYTGDPGQVNGYSEVNNQTDGIPSAAQLTAIKANVELNAAALATRRPANDFFNSRAITRQTVDVEVLSLSDPNNLAEAKDDIEDALLAYFLTLEPYIPGLSVGTRKDQISQAGTAGVVNEVVASRGGTFFGVIVTIGASVVDVYNLAEGEKAKRGAVSYS